MSTLLLVGLLFPLGVAQDDPAGRALPRFDAALQEPPPPSRESGLHFDATLHGRSTIPFGFADRDVITYGGGLFVVDDELRWLDLFDPGWGAEITLDVTMRQSRREAPGRGETEIGGYLSVQVESFEGNSESDSVGNKVSAGDLDATTWLIGAKGTHSLRDKSFADWRFGIGAVHFSAVDATFSGPLFPGVKAELFSSTWTFAMEAHTHAGYRLGPLALVAGVGFKLMLPPDDGSSVSLSSGPLWCLVFDAGIELGF